MSEDSLEGGYVWLRCRTDDQAGIGIVLAYGRIVRTETRELVAF